MDRIVAGIVIGDQIPRPVFAEDGKGDIAAARGIHEVESQVAISRISQLSTLPIESPRGLIAMGDAGGPDLGAQVLVKAAA